MKKYIRLITLVALASIFFVQWMWLNNTYGLLESDFEKKISELFINSVEKEALLRKEDPDGKKESKGKSMVGFDPLNDQYTKNRVLQDFLYTYNYPIISLEKVDSLFKEEVINHYKYTDYSLSITDSLGNQIAYISHAQKNINKHSSYKETIQFRNIAPEYITLVILSSNRILFERMLLILIGSLILAIVIVFSLTLQTGIIIRQDKIAELRQDFTHAMIHDMKNPIMSILTGVRSLKSGLIDDKPQIKERYYIIIIQEGERMLKLTNKILEIAKFEDGREILSKQNISLSYLFEELKEEHILNPNKKVHINIELNGVENIYADLHYIRESFDNLIDNAIKYSKENEDAEIYITVFAKNNTTQIVFKDNGIGIAAKDQKKIFQKFERAKSVIKSKNKISGFGLGLNFVYQIVKAHGGTIKVNSSLGSYSEFIINLPNSKNNT